MHQLCQLFPWCTPSPRLENRQNLELKTQPKLNCQMLLTLTQWRKYISAIICNLRFLPVSKRIRSVFWTPQRIGTGLDHNLINILVYRTCGGFPYAKAIEPSFSIACWALCNMLWKVSAFYLPWDQASNTDRIGSAWLGALPENDFTDTESTATSNVISSCAYKAMWNCMCCADNLLQSTTKHEFVVPWVQLGAGARIMVPAFKG